MFEKKKKLHAAKQVCGPQVMRLCKSFSKVHAGSEVNGEERICAPQMTHSMWKKHCWKGSLQITVSDIKVLAVNKSMKKMKVLPGGSLNLHRLEETAAEPAHRHLGSWPLPDGTARLIQPTGTNLNVLDMMPKTRMRHTEAKPCSHQCCAWLAPTGLPLIYVGTAVNLHT